LDQRRHVRQLAPRSQQLRVGRGSVGWVRELGTFSSQGHGVVLVLIALGFRDGSNRSMAAADHATAERIVAQVAQQLG
jgi:hypothetical protein